MTTPTIPERIIMIFVNNWPHA